MKVRFSNFLGWAAANERKLGAGLFAFGFATDFFTFGLLPVSVVSLIFLGYLALAALCAIGAHAFADAPATKSWSRALAIAFPLGVQYAFGGLLSGLVVFYAAHSVVAASWPFLLFLAAIYVGNEYFRMYKHYLAFQTTLLFFTLYAYAIFALPLYLGVIGPFVFLGSTVLAAAAFGAVLFLLRLVNQKRLEGELKLVSFAAGAVIAAVSLSYFTGVIPPIPLAMKDAGIYHSLEKIPGGYRVKGEAPREWWDLRTPVVHAGAAPVYAYSAVAAPISFSSSVVHRWERDVEGKGWVTESRVSFPISGGREGGYRGYSTKDGLTPGRWRVSVETPNGQVIGRIRFDVAQAVAAPALIETAL